MLQAPTAFLLQQLHIICWYYRLGIQYTSFCYRLRTTFELVFWIVISKVHNTGGSFFLMNHIGVITYHHHKWRQLYAALCSLLTICPLEGIQTRIIIIPWAYCLVLKYLNDSLFSSGSLDCNLVSYISVNFVTKALNYFKTYNYVLVFSPEGTNRLKFTSLMKVVNVCNQFD